MTQTIPQAERAGLPQPWQGKFDSSGGEGSKITERACRYPDCECDILKAALAIFTKKGRLLQVYSGTHERISCDEDMPGSFSFPVSAHSKPLAENLLKLDFTPEKPNTSWMADINYIWTQEG